MSLRIAQDGHARAHPAVYTEGGQAAVGNVGGNITEAQLEDSIWQAVHGRELTQSLHDFERPRPEGDAVVDRAVSVLSCDGVEPPEPRLLWMSTLLAFASTGLPAARIRRAELAV